MGDAAGALMSTGLVCECVATACGHEGGVSCVVSDGEHLYTASMGDDIRMWELPDLAPCTRFASSGADAMCSVKAMVVANHRLFGAHQDHKIRVWSRRHLPTSAAAAANNEKPSHQLVATLPLFKDCLWKGLSQTNYVQVRRHYKKLWIQHNDTISALALSKGTTHKKEVLYSASWDKTVKVWRLSDLKCMESISAHDDAVNALAVCDKSGVLYTGSADGKVKAWGKGLDAEQHRLLATMEGAHQKGASVNALALSDGGQFLFSAGSDGALAVWGREKGEEHVISKLLLNLAGCHPQSILCLCTCKLRQQEGGVGLLLSGSADKTVRVWQIMQDCAGKSGIRIACVGVLQGHAGAVKSICVAASMSSSSSVQPALKMMTIDVVGRGCLVYTGSSDRSIKAWWVSM